MKSVLTMAILVAVSSGAADEKQKPSVLETIRPFKSYGHVYDDDSIEAMRPRVMGTHGVIATGHYLATLAGMEALRKGGNAFDAGSGGDGPGDEMDYAVGRGGLLISTAPAIGRW
jgi:hypothetical protein